MPVKVSGGIVPANNVDLVALGRREGWELWNKFGYNGDVDAGTEIIAAFGGTFSRMTTADTLDIVSSDAADDSGSTGVNSVVIFGVDNNRDPVVEVVVMDGVTPVTTTNQYLGVNRMAIFLAGSGGTNAGTITASPTSGGGTQATMPQEDGVTQQLIFHVPRNYTFLGQYLRFNVNKISGGGSPRVTIKGLVYSAVNGATQEVFRETLDTSVVEDIQLDPPVPFPITEKSIVYFTATTDTPNTVVSGRLSGTLVKSGAA